jgi:hypothetical protein
VPSSSVTYRSIGERYRAPSDRGRPRACNIYDASGDTDPELAKSVYATYGSADVPQPAQNLSSLADLALCHFDCFLSLLPGEDVVRTALPGQFEHFAADAVSAAIAMAGMH